MLSRILEEKKITVYGLSKKAEIPYTTLSDIVLQKTDIKNVSATVLYKLSKALNMTMEELYEGREERTEYYLDNIDRTVIVYAGDRKFSYLGPKNLVAFKRIRKNIKNVLYVDTYFRDDDGRIYDEEDYIDLNDIFEGYEDLLRKSYEILIGRPGESRQKYLVDNSIMVSDNMAILYSDNGTEDTVLEVVNIKRNKDRMLIRLRDYEILYSNMSRVMKKRALEAVMRNRKQLCEEAMEIKNA